MLVVDDQTDAQELIRRVLEECGAKVFTSSSAVEGLQVLEREPSVLLSDIGMPDVDGYEFLKRVRALGPDRGGQVPAWPWPHLRGRKIGPKRYFGFYGPCDEAGGT